MNTEEINKTIGTRLAAMRHARGMTAGDIAEKAAISQHRVTRIEHNRSEATAAELVLIAEALRVTTSVLTGEERFTDFIGRVESAQAEVGTR